MNRFYSLVVVMTGLFVGCSQGISTLDKRITSIKNSADAIAQREGTARGDDLSGIFELKIWYGQLTCRATSKYDAIEALENQVQEISCEQDDGRLECTWVDGSVYEGFVDHDGNFGLAGEFMFEIEEGEKTPAPTTATGVFSPTGKASGSIMVAAKGRQEGSKASCLLTYSFELQKKEEIKNTQNETESDSLKMTFQIQDQTGQRLYRNLKTREDEISVWVGAKGGNDERVVARLHPDGTAEVSAHLVDRDNRTLVKGSLGECVSSEIRPGEVAIECEGSRFQLLLNQN